MGNTAIQRASGDTFVDRGPARRSASNPTSARMSAVMNGKQAPDRRVAKDRRHKGGSRVLALPDPRMAGSALGWAGLIAAMMAANLAGLLAFSSIIRF